MNRIIRIPIYLFSIFIITACGGGGGSGGDVTNDESGTVTVTINLDQLPSTVTYNREETSDGHVEFSWGVTFDVNSDGAINQGDTELRLMHFKHSSSSETTGPISNFQANLWLYTSNTAAQSVAVATVDITGNSITLSIDKGTHPSLASISESTLVYFSTTNRNDISGLPEYDYYPSYLTLVDIPVNKQFTDAQGDVSQQETDMVSMNLSF